MAKETAKATDKKADALKNSVFTAEEFAGMSKQFNTTADIVRATFKVAGITSTTYGEAEKLIADFKKQKVK